MSQQIFKISRRIFIWALLYTGLFILIIVFLYLLFLIQFRDKIFPGVQVANINLAGLTQNQAQTLLSAQLAPHLDSDINLNYQNQSFSLDLASTEPKLDIQPKVAMAYKIGHSGNPLLDIQNQFRAALGINLALEVSFDNRAALISQINNINQQIAQSPQDASISQDSKSTITPSQNGLKLDNQTMLSQISDYLANKSAAPNALPTSIIVPNFTTESAQKAAAILASVNKTPLKLVYGQNSWLLDQAKIRQFIDTNNNQPFLASVNNDSASPLVIQQVSFGNQEISGQGVVLDKQKIDDYLSQIAQQINQPAQEYRFNFDPSTGKVTQFGQAQPGKQLEIDQTQNLISQAILSGNSSPIALAVETLNPKTPEQTNSFGVKQLLGEGVSHFADSIPNRIYNINLATLRINGSLIAPGDSFSFNNSVGEVSAATGYKEGYIISGGRTVLGDGGGVCQVSTTIFRAVLNAGLPVTARTAHAYRVGYYEQGFPPGLDATVYAPSVDFKFKNDTPDYVLVQAHTDGTTLYVDLYGTSDGRVSTVTTPKILSQTPPPPDIRQNDPNLAQGVVQQVDWAAWGAVVVFGRTVTRSGQTLINETYRSNYQPWQAVYLVGTKT